jgi:hypothetical protein
VAISDADAAEAPANTVCDSIPQRLGVSSALCSPSSASGQRADITSAWRRARTHVMTMLASPSAMMRPRKMRRWPRASGSPDAVESCRMDVKPLTCGQHGDSEGAAREPRTGSA